MFTFLLRRYLGSNLGSKWDLPACQGIGFKGGAPMGAKPAFKSPGARQDGKGKQSREPSSNRRRYKNTCNYDVLLSQRIMLMRLHNALFTTLSIMIGNAT